MLHIDRLEAGYGGGTVLHDVTLDVPAGAVHAIIGDNGAGKTTLLGAVAGLVSPRRGVIRLAGQDITGWPSHRRIRAGVALVPQGRRVFASLTVAEHLAIAYRRTSRAGTGSKPWDRRRVLALLPQLAGRLHHLGAHLSGGEQQMLAIARALLTQPRLLLLDEPTEGLAPALAGQVLALVGELADDELTILLAGPDPDVAAVAGRVTTLTAGRTGGAGARPAAAPAEGSAAQRSS
jgi:branched-chain amino acid transport system ATP-binding protein